MTLSRRFGIQSPQQHGSAGADRAVARCGHAGVDSAWLTIFCRFFLIPRGHVWRVDQLGRAAMVTARAGCWRDWEYYRIRRYAGQNGDDADIISQGRSAGWCWLV